MPLDIPAVQRALEQDHLDGWLLYDFQGSNPIATRLSGLASSGKMTTRRWYYLIPASGEPRGLVHAIERYNLDGLPGAKRPYAGREQLTTGLTELLRGMRRVAMEYSPGNAIPYVSRVDAGTVEAVKALGVEVVSSGDLVQRFEAVWSDAAYATHRTASEKLYRIKDRAFDLIRERTRSGTRVTEFEVQEQMVEWFKTRGSRATMRRTSRPRRTPETRTTTRPGNTAARSAGTSSCCSTSGASSPTPARSLLTSPGWASPATPCRPGLRQRSRRSRPDGTPRSSWSRRRRGRAGSCAASKWTGPAGR